MGSEVTSELSLFQDVHDRRCLSRDLYGELLGLSPGRRGRLSTNFDEKSKRGFLGFER